VWNSLPATIRQITGNGRFRQHMKTHSFKGNRSQYSITERMVLGLIPVLGSQPAGDVSH